MRKLFILLTLFFLFSCKTDENKNIENEINNTESIDSLDSTIEASDSLDTMIVSEYDMDKVDKKNVKEFKENLVKIEKEYGTQWDFCTCAVKRDSVNKAFMDKNLSAKEFDKVFLRSDEIDEKCKAFDVQNPNTTPEDRAKHEKMVRDCLKEAGIK